MKKKIYLIVDKAHDFALKVNQGDNQFNFMGETYNVSMKENNKEIYIKIDFMEDLVGAFLKNKYSKKV